MNKVAPFICIPLGLYWIVMGIGKYGLWISNGPGGGLFPVVCGMLLIGCGVTLFIRTVKAKVHIPLDKRAIVFVASAIVIALSMYVIGMIPALGIFILCWLKFFEKQPVVKSAVLGIGTAAFLFIVFRLLLKVPLPLGLLG
ncbi:MAG: tripartite tricarboxylate transporter TctB family protein [Spirochaetales bacterium]|jgi:hypothetical protein|nr:tripartite tricarboxylate transporter TctB family protein [Spirochaetales bacterium]